MKEIPDHVRELMSAKHWAFVALFSIFVLAVGWLIWGCHG